MKFSPGFRGLLLVALAAGVRAEEKPADQPAKSGNWLVDAMAGTTADSRDDSKPGASPAEGGSLKNGSPAYAKPEEGTANPLSSYLTAWMTPHDLEILKIKAADADTPGVTPVVGQDRLASRGPANLHANPYLVDAAPSVVAEPKAPQNTPAAKSLVLAPPADKKDAAPAKTPGPPADLLKSQDDAKYFPQLKRF